MHLDTPVTELNGIGKTRAERLAKLGIRTVRDLIFLYPRAYEHRGDVRMLGEYELNSPKSYILTVASTVSNVKLKNRMTMSKFRAFDESGSVEIIFFNSPFVKDIFHVGCEFRFFGKPQFSKNKRLNLINPKYEPIIEGTPLADLIPIYSLTEGITGKLLDKILKNALDECAKDIVDHLSEDIRVANGLSTLGYAIRNIHFPEDFEALKRAQRRLAFDEMFFFALGISLASKSRTRSAGATFLPCSLKPLTDLLPYELTDSQKNVINDIYRDTVLKRENGVTPAMARIIVGDVGCGKTICAAAALYISAKSGYQSALMVPTEILAHQHYEDISELLGKLGVRVALLTGSTKLKEKKQIYGAIEDGELDVVIGTHALLTDKVNFKNLGLIVTDEQHRFGVRQRAVLKDKTERAHMLVMSATPIPRTLALAMYGDLDISRITEMPKGRMRTDTFVVNESYRKRLDDFILKQVKLGGQCYIICPSIDKNEDDEIMIPYGIDTGLVEYDSLNLKNAVEYTEELRRKLPELTVACLHGKMKNDEKEAIMNSFAVGDINVLVSTTVIEVGVNVPNASLMIVENAERFGLSQLHQLRGRVGRGTRKSYCVLVSDLNTEKSKARLEVLRTTYDGFEIAAKDLALRGPGDFFSQNSDINLRQSGGFDFKIASLCDDNSLFETAFSVAKGLADRDPELALPEHRGIKLHLDGIVTNGSTIS
ncbi:MAG: ATP-dependent DNA helicase RecG [Clostridia bacterium]|nr:ATP-dependent DNA helicase RecG [Clostridia bacterium]